MAEMQEKLSTLRFVGEAGGGQVKVTVDGKSEIISVKFEPELIQAGDVEMIEDLTTAAMRDAATRAREGAQAEMQNALGGLGLPDIGNMFGGGQP
jgi:DNA-binding YbaB/EbfC family protein